MFDLVYIMIREGLFEEVTIEQRRRATQAKIWGRAFSARGYHAKAAVRLVRVRGRKDRDSRSPIMGHGKG